MRFIINVLLFFVGIITPLSVVSAQGNVTTTAEQAIIIDYDTGIVLFEKNADERMPTSSMSKVMTMYMVFDALEKGKISLDDEFLVSEKAWKKGGSKMWVEVNNKARVEDLIRGVVVQSGNDATIVLAEGLAGSEDAFAAAMNSTAKSLGMNNSHFMNASGWPDPDHYSTARDLATLAIASIRNHADYYPYYAETEFTYSGISQPNRNPLLYQNIGADGIKTGHTEDGGYGLIGSAVKDGRRVVIVLNGMESDSERKQESARLMQLALNGFSYVTLFEEGDVLDSVPVYLGQNTSVQVKAEKPVRILAPKLNEDQIKVEVEYQQPLKAPIEAGQKVGVVRVTSPLNDNVIEEPLVASQDVAELSWFLKLIAKARLLSTGEGHIGQ